MIRRAETSSDLATYARLWSELHPDSPISGEEVRRRFAERDDGRRYLIAQVDGRPAGTGFASRTSVEGRAATLVSVLPAFRRRGIGSALLGDSLRVAADLGASVAVGHLAEDALPWAERRGFREFDREVELALDIPRALQTSEAPDGIEIGELQEHELEQAFAVVAEGVADIPSAEPLHASFDRWRTEVASAPLVLVARDGGRVVGYAELERRTSDVLGHELTAVARSHRRRGIAHALKEAQIAWAAACGYRLLITSTHLANEATRRLNDSLGYRALPPLVWVRKELT